MTGRPLTPKQQRFVEEYLVDLNATGAYRRAGYTAKGNAAEVNASRLLRKAKVAEAVAFARAEQSERVNLTADSVIRELMKIGFSDMRRVAKWASNVAVAAPDERTVDEILEDGEIRHAITNVVELVDSDAIDDDTAAAISEISQTDKGGLKVKLHDKRAALVDLGRHLGLFTDRLDITSDGKALGLSAFYSRPGTEGEE